MNTVKFAILNANYISKRLENISRRSIAATVSLRTNASLTFARREGSVDSFKFFECFGQFRRACRARDVMANDAAQAVRFHRRQLA